MIVKGVVLSSFGLTKLTLNSFLIIQPWSLCFSESSFQVKVPTSFFNKNRSRNKKNKKSNKGKKNTTGSFTTSSTTTPKRRHTSTTGNASARRYDASKNKSRSNKKGKLLLLFVSSISSSSGNEESLLNLQHQLVLKTLTRIAIPSLSASLLCFFTFSASTHAIFDYVQTSFNGLETGAGYEALNLILTDNSNQFIQNAHNFLSLNFCFLTSSTLRFLYNNQVKLYHALFEEVSLLFSLVEQVALCSEGRKQVYKLLLLAIQRYINEDLKVITNISSSTSSNATNREDLPLILLCQMPQNDPLQSVLYLTSVGQPGYIYSTIKSLRKARSIRLASLQRKMPEVNMYLLYVLGFTTWVTFPIVTAGASTIGGEALIHLYRKLLSLGVFGMGLVLGILNELKQPEVGSAYNVDYSILGTMLDGLEKEVNGRLMKCDLDDVRNDGPGDIRFDW